MTEHFNYPFTILFNKPDMKCGCVILQNLYGATCTHLTTMMFHEFGWELAPVDDLKMYTVENQAQLDGVLNLCKEKHQEAN